MTVLFIFILNIVNCFLEYGSDNGHISGAVGFGGLIRDHKATSLREQYWLL